MASQREEVLVFTDPYLSAGAQGEDKGLIEKIFLSGGGHYFMLYVYYIILLYFLILFTFFYRIKCINLLIVIKIIYLSYYIYLTQHKLLININLINRKFIMHFYHIINWNL